MRCLHMVGEVRTAAYYVLVVTFTARSAKTARPEIWNR